MPHIWKHICIRNICVHDPKLLPQLVFHMLSSLEREGGRHECSKKTGFSALWQTEMLISLAFSTVSFVLYLHGVSVATCFLVEDRTGKQLREGRWFLVAAWVPDRNLSEINRTKNLQTIWNDSCWQIPSPLSSSGKSWPEGLSINFSIGWIKA